MARRKRSFGSPPAVHRREAARLLKSTRTYVHQFNRYLRFGACKAALGALVRVEALGSAAYREREGEIRGRLLAAGAASRGRSPRGTVGIRYKLMQRFLKKCSVAKRGAR